MPTKKAPRAKKTAAPQKTSAKRGTPSAAKKPGPAAGSAAGKAVTGQAGAGQAAAGKATPTRRGTTKKGLAPSNPPAGKGPGPAAGSETTKAKPVASLAEGFERILSPHGTWRDDPAYGRLWVPDAAEVGDDFAPYRTAGRWAATDDGHWSWVSDYDWGRIPFHYGRWLWTKDKKWAWSPGETYAPAWVVWRVGDAGYDFVGWAPMAPEPKKPAAKKSLATQTSKTEAGSAEAQPRKGAATSEDGGAERPASEPPASAEAASKKAGPKAGPPGSGASAAGSPATAPAASAPGTRLQVLPFFFVSNKHLFLQNLDKYVVRDRTLGKAVKANSEVYAGNVVAGRKGAYKPATPTFSETRVPAFAIPRSRLAARSESVAPLTLAAVRSLVSALGLAPNTSAPAPSAAALGEAGPSASGDGNAATTTRPRKEVTGRRQFATPPAGDGDTKSEAGRAGTAGTANTAAAKPQEKPKYRCWWTNSRPRIWRCGY
ncbi:MAG: DUF6600 domain-containing protein [Myxococcota bacterium]